MTMTTPYDASEGHPLQLRLHRLHGRRVDSAAVPIPREGLVLGADSLAMAGLALHYGALHIAPTHAVVRAGHGGWVLEPGCQTMRVILNDEPVPWGDSRPLHAGDNIDLGFASLRVHGAGLPENSKLPANSGNPIRAVVPSGAASAPGHDPMDAAATAHPGPSLLELADIQVADVPEIPDLSDVPDVPDVPAVPERAAFPARQTLPDGSRIFDHPGITDVPETASPAARPPKPLPVRSPENQEDPLAALAAESARVLAGKNLLTACGLTPFIAPPAPPALDRQAALALRDSARSAPPNSLPESIPLPESVPFAKGVPLAESDPLQIQSPSASLEEILEGPLSIDDVLDKLQRAHPQPAFGTEPGPVNDPLAALSTPEPVPDPLLLLAGVEPLPAREPELAPVLHREHRATGLTSPYRFTVAPNPEDPAEEDSWPLPIR